MIRGYIVLSLTFLIVALLLCMSYKLTRDLSKTIPAERLKIIMWGSLVTLFPQAEKEKVNDE